MALVIFALGLLLVGAISCALGVGASWVLGFFHVVVPWYVCSVALFILGSVFGSSKGGAS